MSPLDDRQIERFRRRLLAAKEAAEELLARSASDARPVEASGSAIGRLTRMDALQVQGMERMSRRQLDIRRQQIEAALAAIEAGTFGSCRHCKGPIALPRLEALPEAPFCLECQERFEREP
jgi:DnaK suppressor protein